MMKIAVLSIFLSVVCLQIALALPAPETAKSTETGDRYYEPEEYERQLGFGTALGYGKGAQQTVSDQQKYYEKHYGGRKRDQASKRGFGTALGHTSNNKGATDDDYLSAWEKAYNALYSGAQKRQIKFGTALGHSSRDSDGDDYISDQNAMFNELFGKRDEVTAETDN